MLELINVWNHRPMLNRMLLVLLLLPLWLFYGVSAIAAESEGRFFGAKETVYPTWFKESFLDIREDVTEAADDGRRVLLFFQQNGCPYCNLMVERNLSQRDIEQQMQRELDVIAVNMWGDREVTDLSGQSLTEKDFAAALRVQFTPTLLFLDESGQVILRLNGYIPPATFKLALDYVGQRLEQRISYRDYAKSRQTGGTPGNKKLHSQPFLSPRPMISAWSANRSPYFSSSATAPPATVCTRSC